MPPRPERHPRSRLSGTRNLTVVSGPL